MTRWLRGSAMAETVITLGFTLTLLMGTIQIVLVGYYQMQLDAATFLNSYEYARTNVAQTSGLSSSLPEQNAMTITTTPTSPPSEEPNDLNGTQVLSEYTTQGYKNGTLSPQTSRYGGAAIVRPQQVSTTGTIDLPSLNFSQCTGNSPGLGFCVPFAPSFQLSSGNIEGRTMVANHDDDGSGVGYNTGAAGMNGDNGGNGTGLVSPTSVGGDDQDVPPYYFAQGYMATCYNGAPLGNCITLSFANACGGCAEHIQALGLAEFLQDSSQTGSLNGNYTTATQSGNGVGTGAIFRAMRCHQNTFATIASGLATTYFSYQNASGADKTLIQSTISGVSSEYDYDITGGGGFPTGSDDGYGPGSKPTFPLRNCP